MMICAEIISRYNSFTNSEEIKQSHESDLTLSFCVGLVMRYKANYSWGGGGISPLTNATDYTWEIPECA